MMGIQVEWHNAERTIIRLDLLGRWTWDEFYTTFEGIKPMMTSVSHTVHMISVLENSHNVPSNPLFHINNFLRGTPPNFGVNIVVGANRFAKPFLPIATRFYPQIVSKLEFASSIEEAEKYLRQL